MRKLMVACVAYAGLMAVPAFAQAGSECGTAGEIITIEKIDAISVAIPVACRAGRQENYVAAPPEAGLSTQEICDKARSPRDYYKLNDPLIPHKNMSACFCYTGQFPQSGFQTKCWTYYDL